MKMENFYVGARFKSFSDFSSIFNYYQAAENVKFKLKNSKTLQNCYRNKRKCNLVQDGYNQELKYYQATYYCTEFSKQGCRASLTIAAVDKENLMIKKADLDHNHNHHVTLPHEVVTSEINETSETDETLEQNENITNINDSVLFSETDGTLRHNEIMRKIRDSVLFSETNETLRQDETMQKIPSSMFSSETDEASRRNEIFQKINDSVLSSEPEIQLQKYECLEALLELWNNGVYKINNISELTKIYFPKIKEEPTDKSSEIG